MTGKRFVKQRDRLGLRFVVALVAGAIVLSDWTVAEAFDFFGLFGSDDTPPPVSRAAIPYTLTVEVAGDPSGLKDSSEGRFVALQPAQGRPCRWRSPRATRPKRFCAGHRRVMGRGLLQRRGDDCDRRRELWRSARATSQPSRAPPKTYRNRAAAPVVIKVEPGPLFKLRTVRVVDALGVEFSEAELPQRIVGLKPGDPAAASEIRAARDPHRRLLSASKGGRSPKSSRSRRSSTTRRTLWT